MKINNIVKATSLSSLKDGTCFGVENRTYFYIKIKSESGANVVNLLSGAAACFHPDLPVTPYYNAEVRLNATSST